jgi:hypothetical protein
VDVIENNIVKYFPEFIKLQPYNNVVWLLAAVNIVVKSISSSREERIDTLA